MTPHPTPHTADLLDVAARACRRAGAHLAGAHATETYAKSGRYDLVTRYDAEAERLIRAELAAAYPHSVVVGEEQGGEPAADLVWYVDPIDGTHNFARGLPLYGISVGAVHRGVPVAGCVYDPVRDELFGAVAGAGAGPVAGPGAAPGQANPGPGPDRLPLVLTDIPTAGTADDAELRLYLRLLDVADVRRIGSSALALAYVSAGRADLAVNADVYPWDTAAGRVLVTAAGGRYTEVPAPRPGLPGGFVAWSPASPAVDALGREVERALRALPALAR
jgi:myo-inositol-1(or 4)-monophosphatase